MSLSNEKLREIWTPNLSSIPILESLNVILMSSIDTVCILLKKDENKSPKMRAFDLIRHTFLAPGRLFRLRTVQTIQMPHNWLPKPLTPRLNLNLDGSFGICLDYAMLAKITI